MKNLHLPFSLSLLSFAAACDLTPPSSLHRVDGGSHGEDARVANRDTASSTDSALAADTAVTPDTAVARDTAPPPDTAPKDTMSRLAKGSTCARADQCQSGFCTDGVCCEQACGGLCSTCGLDTKKGSCVPVPAGEDPDDECGDEGAKSCGKNGSCSGAGTCQLYATDTVCADPSCADGEETSARKCDGQGTCGSATKRRCDPFVCAGAACATSCKTSGDCVGGLTCKEGQCEVDTSGPVAYWKLDESTGTTAADSSSNGNTGTVAGGALWQAEHFPSAMFGDPNSLKLDGVDDLVTVSPSASLNNLRSLSISAWIKPNSAGGGGFGRIVDKRQTSSGWQINLCTGSSSQCPDGNQVTFIQSFSAVQGTWTTAPGTIQFGQWIHVVVTYDAGSDANNPIIYINGTASSVNKLSSPSGSAADDSGVELTIGGRTSGSRTFDGLLDDVRVYNRILPAADVASLFAGN